MPPAPGKGFFNKIPCPVQGCHAPDCMFAHADDSSSTVQPIVTPAEPASKRRRLGGELTQHDLDAAFAPDLDEATNDKLNGGVATLIDVQSPHPSPPASDNTSEDTSVEKNVVASNLDDKSQRSEISPPPLRRAETASSAPVVAPKIAPTPKVDEELNPRSMTHPPAGHPTRYLYLTKLHEAMKSLNDKLRTTENKDASTALSNAQLITKALDEEVKIATETPSVYPNVLKQTLLSYKKMDVDQWRAAISHVNIQTNAVVPPSAARPQVKSERTLDSGLSESQDRQILSRLLARQDGLEEFGYVTTLPTEDEMDEARAAFKASASYEKCERCQSRFQVYPDKREDGLLTSGGECLYHHGRIAKAEGKSEKIHSCCNEALGESLGCTTCESHVFKVYDSKRLSSLVPYKCTPDNTALDNDRAVTFDCEMGFTTNGMELIRLTALSWPNGEMLLDILVRPLGAILDLNTRYSGVSTSQFSKAKPYDHGKAPDAQGEGLRIVKSVVYARKLLFSLLTPSTPLIGHAIENDLNATRIVHPCIVDTVLLCPHPAGRLPYRRSLKALAQDYLWRIIQTAGAQGHDSMEDARATGDIVREVVKRTWFKMKRNGWQLKDDTLVPPSPSLKPTGAPLAPPQNRSEVHLRREAEKWADANRMNKDTRQVAESRGEKRSYDDLDDLITVEMNYG